MVWWFWAWPVWCVVAEFQASRSRSRRPPPSPPSSTPPRASGKTCPTLPCPAHPAHNTKHSPHTHTRATWRWVGFTLPLKLHYLQLRLVTRVELAEHNRSGSLQERLLELRLRLLVLLWSNAGEP